MPTKAGPKPQDQRQASTLFLRVPADEYRAVIAGRKTEFRALPGQPSQLHKAVTPTPVVAYRQRPAPGQRVSAGSSPLLRQYRWDFELMVLESTWQEPLGSIQPDSLEREGQPDLAHFRRYWMARTKRAFRPTRMVVVYRVRPWDDDLDRDTFAHALLERLYGSFLK